MGAWGAGPFENDDAADWVYELEGVNDANVVREALDVSEAEYLEVDQGAVAVAAAAVVAAALGSGHLSLPDEVVGWLGHNRGSLTSSDALLAIAAAERTLAAESEIRELWDEAEDDSWVQETESLVRRLREAV